MGRAPSSHHTPFDSALIAEPPLFWMMMFCPFGVDACKHLPGTRGGSVVKRGCSGQSDIEDFCFLGGGRLVFWGQQGLNILQPYSHGTASFLAHFAPQPPHLVCELLGWSIDSVTDMKHQCFSIIRASNFFAAFVRPVRESQVLTSTKFEREDGFAPENMLCYLVTSGVGVACHPKVLQGDIEWDNGNSFAHQHFTKCIKYFKGNNILVVFAVYTLLYSVRWIFLRRELRW